MGEETNRTESSEKQQAYIGKIIEVNTIEGADFIESVTVVCGKGGRWMGTVQKGQFRMDDNIAPGVHDIGITGFSELQA